MTLECYLFWESWIRWRLASILIQHQTAEVLFFPVSENITSKSRGFSFHGVDSILAFFSNLLDSIPVLFLLFLHFWTIAFRKSSK